MPSLQRRLIIAPLAAALLLGACRQQAGAPPGPVHPARPVPEPASWALMAVGVGGVGAMLRRRRAGVGTVKAS
jgi:hypothetical protein